MSQQHNGRHSEYACCPTIYIHSSVNRPGSHLSLPEPRKGKKLVFFMEIVQNRTHLLKQTPAFLPHLPQHFQILPERRIIQLPFYLTLPFIHFIQLRRCKSNARSFLLHPSGTFLNSLQKYFHYPLLFPGTRPIWFGIGGLQAPSE